MEGTETSKLGPYTVHVLDEFTSFFFNRSIVAWGYILTYILVILRSNETPIVHFDAVSVVLILLQLSYLSSVASLNASLFIVKAGLNNPELSQSSEFVNSVIYAILSLVPLADIEVSIVQLQFTVSETLNVAELVWSPAVLPSWVTLAVALVPVFVYSNFKVPNVLLSWAPVTPPTTL